MAHQVPDFLSGCTNKSSHHTIVDSRTTGFNQSCRNLNWKLKHHNAFFTFTDYDYTTEWKHFELFLPQETDTVAQTSKQTNNGLLVVYSVLTMP